MNHYDIVFIGIWVRAQLFLSRDPFRRMGRSGSFMVPMAASCLGKRIAAVTKFPRAIEQLLEPLKAAGIDLFVQPGETTQYRVVFPTANVDQRQAYHIKGGGYFGIDDMPPIEPCLIHLGCIGFAIPLDFIQALKARGFRLSVDMQGFMFQVDDQTGARSPKRCSGEKRNPEHGRFRKA